MASDFLKVFHFSVPFGPTLGLPSPPPPREHLTAAEPLRHGAMQAALSETEATRNDVPRRRGAAGGFAEDEDAKIALEQVSGILWEVRAGRKVLGCRSAWFFVVCVCVSARARGFDFGLGAWVAWWCYCDCHDEFRLLLSSAANGAL